jgi:hypothetical protein
LRRPLSVALGEKDHDRIGRIAYADTQTSPFEIIFSCWGAAVAGFFTIALVIGIIVLGQNTNLLRDPLLPQLQQSEQTYSLARCQMAFWTVLIVASYMSLYALLGDLNSITEQALWLMGISSATGAGAIFVDAYKDTPVDRANAYLRTLGLKNHDDVDAIAEQQAAAKVDIAALERVIQNDFPEIQNAADRLAAVDKAKADKLNLQNKNYDRQLLLNTYQRTVEPFRSDGFWKDLMTDINGSVLHRVQLVCWTLILGGVFIREEWLHLAMPQFSATVLLLLGISGGSYVGFKYPEVQH